MAAFGVLEDKVGLWWEYIYRFQSTLPRGERLIMQCSRSQAYIDSNQCMSIIHWNLSKNFKP